MLSDIATTEVPKCAIDETAPKGIESKTLTKFSSIKPDFSVNLP